MSSPKDEAAAVLGGLETRVDRFNETALRIYLERLLSLNPQLGLISKRDPVTVARRLVDRSVALWDFLQANTGAGGSAPRRVADIGPGAGFPGLIWKLLVPDLPVTLIERKSRRVHFLEQMVVVLKLENIDVIESDLREVHRHNSLRDRFDVVTLVAVSPPEALAAGIESLLRVDGHLVAVGARSSARRVGQRIGSTLSLVAQERSPDGALVLYRKLRPAGRSRV